MNLTLTQTRPVLSTRWTVALSLLSIYLIWGSTYLTVRIAVQEIPPFMLGGVRLTLAGLLLMGITRGRGIALPERGQWPKIALIGALLLVVGQGGTTFALQHVASGLTAVANAAIPLWAALFAGWWERWPTRTEWFGLALGLAGVIALNTGADLWLNPLGGLALLIAPMSWAFGSVMSRHIRLAPGAMTNGGQMLIGGLMLMGLSTLRGEHLASVPSLPVIGAMVYLILVGSIVGFTAYNYLLRSVKPVLATSYAYVNPLVALFMGWMLAGEELTLQIAIASALILSAVVLITTARAVKTPDAENLSTTRYLRFLR